MTVSRGVHVFGGRLVLSDGAAAGLTVSFLAQSVRESVIPERGKTEIQLEGKDERRHASLFLVYLLSSCHYRTHFVVDNLGDSHIFKIGGNDSS